MSLKDIISLSCILITLIFLVSCGGYSSNQPAPITDVEYRTGTDSLEIDFVKGYPPDEIPEETSMVMSIELSNQGASDIDKGIIVLNYEQNYIRMLGFGRSSIEFIEESESKAVFNLRGRSIMDDKGETGLLSVEAMSRELDEQTQTHTTPIIVTACYKYSTTLSTTACVDTDVYNVRNSEKICEVDDISAGTQGSPLVISDIEVSMVPLGETRVKPQFLITIKNKGLGEVFDKDHIANMCSSEPLDYKKINVFSLNASLSGEPLRCEPERLVLRDKEAKVRCYLESGIPKTQGTYLASLLIDLDFGYTQSVSKDIEIRRLII